MDVGRVPLQDDPIEEDEGVDQNGPYHEFSEENQRHKARTEDEFVHPRQRRADDHHAQNDVRALEIGPVGPEQFGRLQRQTVDDNARRDGVQAGEFGEFLEAGLYVEGTARGEVVPKVAS